MAPVRYAFDAPSRYSQECITRTCDPKTGDPRTGVGKFHVWDEGQPEPLGIVSPSDVSQGQAAQGRVTQGQATQVIMFGVDAGIILYCLLWISFRQSFFVCVHPDDLLNVLDLIHAHEIICVTHDVLELPDLFIPLD